MNKLVYLCGPITGCTPDGASSWREYVSEELRAIDLTPLDPMRFERYHSEGPVFAAHGSGKHPLVTNRGIVARDRFDTLRAGMVFCNLLGAKIVSIGSMIEVGWCDAMGIQLLVVMEPNGNVHDHGMVTEIASYIVPTLDEGIRICDAVLNP